VHVGYHVGEGCGEPPGVNRFWDVRDVDVEVVIRALSRYRESGERGGVSRCESPQDEQCRCMFGLPGGSAEGPSSCRVGI